MGKKSTEQEAPPATPAEVREWAKANGHVVAAKGRLSASLKEAFTAATGRAA